MEDSPSAFADWVSATAKGLGYRTDSQLAAALGIQQSTVTRWRQGSRPHIQHLVELARLFQMKIDPLLAMSGHVPVELLNDVEPPGPLMTESVRRIRDSSLNEFQKEALTRYWDARLGEEREKLNLLISYLKHGSGIPRHHVGNMMMDLMRIAGHSEAVAHLTELLQAVMAVEALPRKRRRRGSHDEDAFTSTDGLGEIVINSIATLQVDRAGEEDSPEDSKPEDGTKELEP